MSDIRDLAEAYVMGWLEPELRDEVSARVADLQSDADRLLARDVARVQAAWENLDLAVDPISPPADMWGKIEAALDADQADRGTVVPMPPKDIPLESRGSNGGLRVWQSVAGLAVAASVALGALLVSQVLTPPHA